MSKPAYYDKHPCVTCSTGYLECAQYARLSLKCCDGCVHPTRWTAMPPYTAEELEEMKASRD